MFHLILNQSGPENSQFQKIRKKSGPELDPKWTYFEFQKKILSKNAWRILHGKKSGPTIDLFAKFVILAKMKG